MKLIDKLGTMLNQNFNAKSLNLLIILGIGIMYSGLIDIIIRSLGYVLCYFNKKACYDGETEYIFKLVFIILSPISLANYYYNRSKFEAAEVGKIRTIIILLCAVFLCFNFFGWLEKSKFIYSFPSSYVLKILGVILIVLYLIIVKPHLVTKLTPKTSIIIYILAHLFWVVTLFFMIGWMVYSGFEETVFTKANLIILLVLTSIAVTYSFTQQYFYKRLTKSKDIKEVSKKLMSEIINLK